MMRIVLLEKGVAILFLSSKSWLTILKISSCFYSDFRDILCTGHQLKGKSIEKTPLLNEKIFFFTYSLVISIQ